MKIVVQGNCQSRPVSTFLDVACEKAELLPPVVTQLQTDADMENDYKAFSSADVIFAQWVSDDYRVGHLATSRIKAEFGDKVVTWPNAFFIGQNPDIVAIATDTKPRLIGPLDTYHVRSIFKSWINDVSVSDCLSEQTNPSIYPNKLLENVETSLTELGNREQLLDIGISDYVKQHWLDKKLFHVFNHPTNALLVELVNRMCKFINMDSSVSILPEFWPEYLNRIIAPSTPAIDSALGFKFKTSTASKGFSLTMNEEKGLQLGEISVMSVEKLVEKFYFSYDNQISRSDEYKFTPVYLQENYQLEKAA